MKKMLIKMTAALVVLAAVGLAGAPSADAHVNWSIGLNFGVPVYSYQPYYSPPPPPAPVAVYPGYYGGYRDYGDGPRYYRHHHRRYYEQPREYVYPRYYLRERW